MKKEGHPEYKEVVFRDVSCDFKVLTRSTIKSDQTIQMEDGKEYPVVDVQISSASHPFYTGKQKIMDTAGRIDRFKKKFGSNIALGNQKRRKFDPKAAMKKQQTSNAEKLEQLKNKKTDNK